MNVETYKLIESMTDDEDFRQELVLYCLENDTTEGLKEHLEYLKEKESAIVNNKANKALLFLQDKKNTNKLNKLTDYEKAATAMVVNGFSINYISYINKLSIIRVKELIMTIVDKLSRN